MFLTYFSIYIQISEAQKVCSPCHVNLDQNKKEKEDERTQKSGISISMRKSETTRRRGTEPRSKQGEEDERMQKSGNRAENPTTQESGARKQKKTGRPEGSVSVRYKI